jgi:transcriptional regulator NrdR family protein
MKCTKCGAGKAKVLETRVHPQWSYLVRRRYKCNDCGERFFTLEVTSRLKGTVYEHMPSSEEALRKIVHRHHRDKEIISRIRAGEKRAVVALEMGMAEPVVEMVLRRNGIRSTRKKLDSGEKPQEN